MDLRRLLQERGRALAHRRRRSLRQFIPTVQPLERRRLLTTVTDQYAPYAGDGAFNDTVDMMLSGSLINSASDPQGLPLTFATASGPSHANAFTFNSDGSFEYRPDLGFEGTDSFTYYVNNGTDTSLDGTVTINVSSPLHANNVSYTDLLNHGFGGGIADQVTGAPAGSTLTFQIVAPAAHGSAVLDGDGALAYTPDTGFVGADSFTYLASDGADDSNVATVYINVRSAIQAESVSFTDPVNQVLSDTLSNSASDPSGGPLFFGTAWNPSHGTVSVNGDGSFIYVPDQGFVGTDRFYWLASDATSESNVATATINVVAQPPQATGALYQVSPGQQIAGSLVNDASDPYGLPLTFYTATSPGHGTLWLSPSGAFSYTPASGFAGTDAFTYFVSDGGLTSSVATVAVNVGYSRPQASNASFSDAENQSVGGSLGSSASDPNGLGLTFQAMSSPPHGTLSFTSTGSFVYTPSSGFVGTDSFTYQVYDGLAAPSNIATVTIKVFSPLPQAQSVSFTDQRNQALSGSLQTDASDPYGLTLTFYEVGAPSHGQLRFYGGGTFVYTPSGGFAGTDSFTYVVSDGLATSNVATVTIKVAGPPQASSATFVVPAGHPLSGTLSGAAFDPSGYQLGFYVYANPQYGRLLLNADGSFTYTPVPGVQGTDSFAYQVYDGTAWSNVAVVTIKLQYPPPIADDARFTVPDTQTLSGSLAGFAIDPNGRSLTFQRISSPSAGTFSFGSGGSFSYTPSPGFVGADSFNYEVYDGLAATSNIATVTINVLGVPQAGDAAFAIANTQTLSASLSSSASDPNNRPLTFQNTTSPGHGTLVFDADGSFVYTPTHGFMGTDSFTYVVYDGVAPTSNVATVTVSVLGPPSASNAYFSDGFDHVLSGSLGADAIDPNGLPTTFQAVTGPGHGILTLQADGSFTYIPHGNFVGEDRFTYDLADGILTSNPATVTITVLGPPTAGNAVFSADYERPLTSSLAGDASDPHGDPITFATASGPGHGSLTLSSSGSFTYTPAQGFGGADSFAYQVSDGVAASNVAIVTINVSFPRPWAGDAWFQEGYNQPLSATLAPDASDPPGAPLTFAMVSAPVHGTLALDDDGSFQYTPPSTFIGLATFTYQVSNPTTTSRVATVNIDVLGPPQARTASFSAGPNRVLDESLAGAGFDPDGDALTFALVGGAANGSVSLQSNGSFRYLPADGFSGADSFRYDVSDGITTSNVATVTIDVPAFHADDYSLSTTYEQPMSGWLSARYTYYLDPALTYSLVAPATNGTLVFNSNGSFTYTPGYGFLGADSFTYQVRDAATVSNAATVSIAVMPPAPVADDASFTGTANQTMIGSLGMHASDPVLPITFQAYGEPLNGTLTLNGDGDFSFTPATGFVGTATFGYDVTDGTTVSNVGTVSIDVLEAPSTQDLAPVAGDDAASTPLNAPLHGSLAGDVRDPAGGAVQFSMDLPPSFGTLALAPDGSFIYTPEQGYTGTDQFRFFASDGPLASADATVTIDVQPPTALHSDALVADGASITTEANQAVIGSLAGDASNALGGSFTFLLDNGADHGSVVLGADGAFTYTPDQGYAGPDSFHYYIYDGTYTSYDAIVAIDVSAPAGPQYAPPQAQNLAYTITTGQELDGALSTTDPVDGDLTYSAGAAPTHGALSVTADGWFLYTPDPGFGGEDSFSYQATSSDGLTSNSATVTINVDYPANEQFSSLPPRADNAYFNTSPGQEVDGSAPATDPAGGSLTYTLSGDGPSNGTLTFNADGSFRYTPSSGFAGEDSFGFEVTSSDGLTSNVASVGIDVLYPPNPQTGPMTLQGNDVLLQATMDQELDGSATDAGESNLSFSASGASNGSLTFNDDGTFSYVPNSGFVGLDSFAYTETDDDTGASSSATVWILVQYPANPSVPPEVHDATFAMTADQELDGTLPITDSTGGPYSYSMSGSWRGSLSLYPDGTFSYIPPSGFEGEDSFSFSVNGSLQATIFIDIGLYPANTVPPPSSDNAWVTTNIGQEYSGAVSASDPLGLPLTYYAGLAAHGTLTFNSDGTFDYTSDDGFEGTDSFSYYASDGTYSSNLSTVFIDVVNPANPENLPPTAGAASFRTIAGQEVDGSLAADASDPAGQALSSCLNADAGNGQVVLNADGTFTYTPADGYVGPDSFSYIVNDGFLDSNVAYVSIEVEPPPATRSSAPTAEAAFFATSAGQELDGSLQEDAFDPARLGLTFSLSSSAANGTAAVHTDGTFSYMPGAGFVGLDHFTYVVSDGVQPSVPATVTIAVRDHTPAPAPAPLALNASFTTPVGQSLTASLADDAVDPTGGVPTFSLETSAGDGDVVLDSDGTFTYTPGAGFTSSDSFTYRVSDGLQQSNVATVTINAQAAPPAQPVAADDSYTIAHDHTLTVRAAAGVLFNDTDPSGGTLSAVAGTITTTQGGTVALAADGSFTYTPPAHYVGPDSFSYEAVDGSGNSSAGTVHINVTQAAPVALSDVYTLPDDPTLAVLQRSVVLNDTDADGDALTAALASGYPLPTYGTLDFLPDGRFIYTPAGGHLGTYSFWYEAYDGLFYSDPTLVTIVVTNKPPTVQPASYTLPAVATTIAASSGVLATAADPYGYTLTAVKASGPSHGTLTLRADGGFTYTPVSGYTGPDSFQFYADDGVNHSATVTVALNIENTPASPGPVQPDGSTYTYAVQPGGSTSWTAAAGVLSNASDPYGDSLTAALDSGPSHGSLSLGADGSFTYTPSDGFTGTDSFTYNVSDGVYTTSPATVAIHVDSNEPPVADTGAALTYAVTPNHVLTTTSSDGLLARAVDPYGYSLTAILVSGPSKGTLTLNGDGSFTYATNPNASGTDTFTYKANDGLNDSAHTTVTIHIDSSEPPIADAGAPYRYAVQPGATLTTTAANGLLSDATDPYGYALTAVPAPDPSNGTLTVNSNGSFTYATWWTALTVDPDGSFTYTSLPGMSGANTFTFRAYDGLNYSTPASFTIQLTSSASPGGDSSGGGAPDPTAEASGDVTDPTPVAEDDSYTIAPDQTLLTPIGQGVLANDSDPEGKTLTAILVQNPSGGTLTLQSDGLFSYTPGPGFAGSAAFTYKATDGTYTSTPATVTITVTADAPGGTKDGGVAFGGLSQAGSGFANQDLPDGFNPTPSGPGLQAPGVYAAGFHAAGSQAAVLASSLGTAAATINTGSPYENHPIAGASGTAPFTLPPAGYYGAAFSLTAPAVGGAVWSIIASNEVTPGMGAAALAITSSFAQQPGSGSAGSGATSWSWDVSRDGDSWSGTLVEDVSGQDGPIDTESSTSWTWTSTGGYVNGWMIGSSWDESVTGTTSWHSTDSHDVNSSSGQSIGTSEAGGGWSTSFSDEITGGYDATDNSYWTSESGGGTYGTESDANSSWGDGLDSDTLSSSAWGTVTSQYSSTRNGADSRTHVEAEINSGQSGSTENVVGTPQSGSYSTVESWSDITSSDQYVNTSGFADQVGFHSTTNTGGDTSASGSSTTSGLNLSTTVGWTDSNTTEDTFTSVSDQYTDTTITDGQGNWSDQGTVSASESSRDDYDQYIAFGVSLPGGGRETSADAGRHSSASGTYSSSYDDTDGVDTGATTDWGQGSASNYQDNGNTLHESVSEGTSDATQGEDSWASYTAEHSDHSSSGPAGNDTGSDWSNSGSGGDSTFDHQAASTSTAEGSRASTIDSWANDSATSSADSNTEDDNGVSSGSSDGSWTTRSAANTSATTINDTSTSSGWSGLTHTVAWWNGDTGSGSNSASSDGLGNADSESDSTLTTTWGDIYNDHDTATTSLSGSADPTTSNAWGHDSGRIVAASDDEWNNGVDNGSDTTSSDSQGVADGNSSQGPAVQQFASWPAYGQSYTDTGTETYAASGDWSYSYGDEQSFGTHTSDNVITSFTDSTHTDTGGGHTTATDEGSDDFNAATRNFATGTSIQYGGSEQFSVERDSSIDYSHRTVTGANGTTNSITSDVENHSTFNVEGDDSFAMSAVDPSTSDTSWDNGGEDYNEGRTLSSYNDQAATTTFFSPIGLAGSTWDATIDSGGTDTLSTGDQIDDDYGYVSTDPATGDVNSQIGTEDYLLGKSYSDTFSDENIAGTGNPTTTTHTDSGFGGGSFDDDRSETDLTTTTDPDTGDFSGDQNSDSHTEQDASTESFTDASSSTVSGTDSSRSTSHTDNGSDTVSSWDQDTDISSEMSNYGRAGSVSSDTTTEWDSSSDSYGDQTSEVETVLDGAPTVTNSSTYSDSGWDTNSTNDQGTDTSSDASSDGLETDASGDVYTNTESASDCYTDQSSTFENVAAGVVVSASDSDGGGDSGTDTSWSYESGTNSQSWSSQDGLESDSGSDSYTDTENSSDSYADSSIDSEDEAGGAPMAATSTATHNDSGTDSSWGHDYGTDTASSAAEDGGASNSALDTFTTIAISADTSSDQSSDGETEAGGAVSSATSAATSTDTSTDASSDVEYESKVKVTPTDSGSERVSSTYRDESTSSDAETDTSSDTSSDQQGTLTGTQITSSLGSGMESSTETSSGTESFSGIIEDDSDFSGSGSFTETAFDSTTYTNNDGSNTTTDGAGNLNGTTSSDDYGNDIWSQSRQDMDNVSSSGSGDQPVTLTEQDFGTTTTQSNPVTSYSGGTPTQQGGTTVQTSETHSVSENDSYSDVINDAETDTTDGSANPSYGLTTKAAAQYTPPAEPGSGNSQTEQKQGTQSAAGAAVQLAKGVLSYGADFNAGVVQGFFVDGLRGDLSVLGGAIGGAASGISFLTRNASDFYFRTHFVSDQEITALGNSTLALENFGAALRTHGSEMVQAILSGDTAAQAKYGFFVAQLMDAGGGLLTEIGNAVSKNVTDPTMQGRIVGWALWQVALAVATSGAASALKAGRAASIASKLDGLAFLRDNPFLLKSLKAIFNKADDASLPKLPVGPSDLAGSGEKKALRWKEYQERGGEWPYERWSKTYDANQARALNANRAVEGYHKQLGWGKREVTVDVEGVTRRLDIADVATRRGIEYKQGYQSLTQDNLWELTRDELLVKQGWDIEWVFEGTASKPLVDALERAGVGVVFR
jgi:hypothetical protein